MSLIQIVDANNETARAAKLLAGIPGALEKAQWDAMKRGGQTARKEAAQFATARYKIGSGTFKGHVTTKVHGEGTAEISISFAGSVLPLKLFKVHATSKGVVASVKDGGGTIARGFISQKMGGNVFERVAAPRTPVEAKMGPSTGHMMQDEEVQEQMSKAIEVEYEKRMEHEITRILNGW